MSLLVNIIKLVRSAMYRLLTGEIDSYKGWTVPKKP